MGRNRILVIGASGTLGSALVSRAPSFMTVLGTHKTRPAEFPSGPTVALDITSERAVQSVIGGFAPNLLIHTAYTRGYQMRRVIEGGMENLLRALQGSEGSMIYLSTDLVFDGRRGAYSENDDPVPVLTYGVSKRKSELPLLEAGGSVIRTSLLVNGDPLPAVFADYRRRLVQGTAYPLYRDEFRSPVGVNDVADAILELAEKPSRPALLHVAGPERMSRLELGRKLYGATGIAAERIPAGDRPGTGDRPGKDRPADCSLDSSRADRLLNTRIRTIDRYLMEEGEG